MIKIIDEKNVSPQIRRKIEEISNLPGVKQVAVFPDVHLKAKYTRLGYRIDIPSSLAILTQNCLYPQFRSRGINCGMSLVRTNLFYQEDLLPKLEKVLRRFNPFPLMDKFSLSTKEFQQICREGMADFDYSGIRPEWRKGNLRLKRRLGRHFGGNHFLEFQAVDEIFDERKAQEWGIKNGQVYILYHTAGEDLEDILEEKVVQEVIRQPRFVRLEPSSKNAQIIMKAIKILMNYGFAYRKTTLFILKDLADRVLGRKLELRGWVDNFHNSVEETDSNSFIYRHNVNKVSAGAPVILSGFHNLRSYVNVGEPGAADFLWSADHGYGDLIKRFPSFSVSNLKVRRIWLKRGLNLPFFLKKDEIGLEQSLAAERVLSLLEKNKIARRVFSLRPIINFRFT